MMSNQFEQSFSSEHGAENITFIQYIQPESEGEQINVIIPNNYHLGEMKEEYLEEFHVVSDQNVEVLESVVTINKKPKPNKVEKELVQISSDSGKPKGRKRAVADQTRAIRKLRANTNQAYVNSKGNEVQPKEFDAEYECACPKKCTRKISKKCRKQIFTMFWGIGTYGGRCAFLNSCINEVPKKRQYTKNEKSRRNNTRKYYLKGTEVCKTLFVKTLQISNSRIDVCLQKMESENFTDERGKKRLGHGFSDELKEQVIQHIKDNFRHDSSLRGLWNTYLALHPDHPVSESYYKSKLLRLQKVIELNSIYFF